MTLKAAAGGFVLLLIALPVITGQGDWAVTYTSTQICALKGSTVNVPCTFTYPSTESSKVEKRFWFIKGGSRALVDLITESNYTDRVEYQFHENDCTLMITDLRESDSNKYKFRFTTNLPGGSFIGSPGVSLSVTDLWVQVTRPGSDVELRCRSSCDVAADHTYVWYKNEQGMDEETSTYRVSFNDKNSYSCAVEGHEYRSLPVYAPKPPSVSVSPSAEIVEGSSVTLNCSSDANPGAKYTWYKEDGNLKPRKKGRRLVFSSIQSSDSGQFYCKAENRLGTDRSEFISIDVKYAPKLPSVSVSPSAEIVEGSSVTLTCSSDANPAANYTWYKTDQTHPHGEGDIYRFTSISSEDRGIYYCKSENPHGSIDSSDQYINVQYAPKLPSVSVSPSAEIVEGSSVTLTCSSDANPAANYTWYKKDQTHPHGEGDIYRFTSISSEDRGIYYCKSENPHGSIDSSDQYINVQYAPKLPSVSVSPSAEIVEGSSVTLTCSSDANPAANYTWYKTDQTHPHGEGDIYRFTSISSEDRGIYYCKSENPHGSIDSSDQYINVQYAPKLPSVSVSPSAEIVEGSSVTLTCSSDANPPATYTWYKEDQTHPRGEGDIYRFTSISAEDSGIYYCKSENQYAEIDSSSLDIDIQYAPKLPSVSVSPSAEIVEGSSVTLTCSSDANPAANYTWYKEDEDSPKVSGQIFIITDFRAEHSGNYSCEAQNTRGRRSTTFHLIVVAGAWRLIAVATVPAFFLAIILISVFLWIIKKRSSKPPSAHGGRPDTREQMQPAEPEDGLHYATVHFSKKQADPVYSNIGPAQPRCKEEETIVYAAVTFNTATSRTRSQEAAEDPAALYSTVNKKRNL